MNERHFEPWNMLRCECSVFKIELNRWCTGLGCALCEASHSHYAGRHFICCQSSDGFRVASNLFNSRRNRHHIELGLAHWRGVFCQLLLWGRSAVERERWWPKIKRNISCEIVPFVLIICRRHATFNRNSNVNTNFQKIRNSAAFRV